MANKQYCFDISNPSNDSIDIEDFKQFINNLYVGDEDYQFNPDEKIPFIVIYNEDRICILLTSKSRKVIEKIEEINEILIDRDIIYNNISLSVPYEFEIDIDDWWGQSKLNSNKWNTLEHNGPYFPYLMTEYVYLNSYLKYGSKKLYLSPEEEKVARLYANRKISEEGGNIIKFETKDPIFNTNFWTDFQSYLRPALRKDIKDFLKIDWSNLMDKIKEQKERENTPEFKRAKKIKTEEVRSKYGYAMVDGKLEKLGNYTVEPQGIFMGRGENPNRGRIKLEIRPEDVTINIGFNASIPKAPEGHEWGEIVHDRNSVWVAKWNDTITGDIKYVLFAAEGKFKGQSDLVKYEKARKLQKYIGDIRSIYMTDAKSQDKDKMQLGTILYLIDHYGIRVGNEKKEDETDTVGASTLRVDHLKFEDGDVIFDFLGKDSIRFYKRLEVPELIFNNLYSLTQNKNRDSQIFTITSSIINEYLKQFDKNFSAKVFRTKLASHIMYEALKDVNIPADSTKTAIKALFNTANVKVAEVLNHTRTVSKKAEESVQKDKDKLKTTEKKLKDEKKSLKKFKLEDDTKNINKTTKSIEKIMKQIDTLKNRIASKTDVLSVSINTSLTNYIDPRLIVSWCKKQNVDVSVIYTTALIKKFTWAIETTSESWDWLTEPLIGNKELEPAEPKEPKPAKPKEPKPKEPDGPRIEAYTEKSFVVLGVLPKYKRDFVNMGGKWNPNLSVGPAWVFSNNKLATVEEWLRNIDKEPVIIDDDRDYDLFLEICTNLKKNGMKMLEINKEKLGLFYKLSMFALKNGKNVKFNTKFTKLYEEMNR